MEGLLYLLYVSTPFNPVVIVVSIILLILTSILSLFIKRIPNQTSKKWLWLYISSFALHIVYWLIIYVLSSGINNLRPLNDVLLIPIIALIIPTFVYFIGYFIYDKIHNARSTEVALGVYNNYVFYTLVIITFVVLINTNFSYSSRILRNLIINFFAF